VKSVEGDFQAEHIENGEHFLKTVVNNHDPTFIARKSVDHNGFVGGSYSRDSVKGGPSCPSIQRLYEMCPTLLWSASFER